MFYQDICICLQPCKRVIPFPSLRWPSIIGRTSNHGRPKQQMNYIYIYIYIYVIWQGKPQKSTCSILFSRMAGYLIYFLQPLIREIWLLHWMTFWFSRVYWACTITTFDKGDMVIALNDLLMFKGILSVHHHHHLTYQVMLQLNACHFQPRELN